MSDTRKEYTVEIGGVTHTLLLTSEDAERYGEHAKPAKASSAQNKQAGAQNKSA